ncbi:MAG: integrase [Mucilaginibacter sp.]|nr:integrase [Mucilaginibacter sp.]
MKKRNIHAVTKACLAWLKQDGYSEARIRDYVRLWNYGIVKYMREHDITMFSSQVSDDFINSIPSFSPSYLRTIRRSVSVLKDFLVNGSVSKRIVPRVKHELPGEIGAAAETYLASLTELRRSIFTIENHRRVLSYFVHYLSLNSVCLISNINEEAILGFLASAQNCTDHYLNATRQFCRYMYSCKLLERNVEYVIGRNALNKREKIPSVYDAVEVRQIEDAVDQSGPVGKRDYAILLLATRLGLRSSDIAGLQLDNLDWENNLIGLTQYKTKRMIELPLLSDVGDAIIKYLQHVRPVSSEPNVFLSACAPYRKINRLIINGIISRTIKASKVDIRNRKFGPHAMRHTLATRLLGNGTSLPVISEALGHKSTQTTMKYLRVDINNLQRCTLDVPLVAESFYEQKGGMFYD